jgi:DNA methylase
VFRIGTILALAAAIAPARVSNRNARSAPRSERRDQGRPAAHHRQGGEWTAAVTQKPIELMRRPILNHTRRGELVYEPFLGSGTTLAAAEITERVCYGVELDPKYVDVVIQRWQELTGKKATLESDGRSFDEIALGRQKGDE